MRPSGSSGSAARYAGAAEEGSSAASLADIGVLTDFTGSELMSWGGAEGAKSLAGMRALPITWVPRKRRSVTSTWMFAESTWKRILIKNRFSQETNYLQGKGVLKDHTSCTNLFCAGKHKADDLWKSHLRVQKAHGIVKKTNRHYLYRLWVIFSVIVCTVSKSGKNQNCRLKDSDGS